MTDITSTATDGALAAHRTIRRIGQGEGPFAGDLVMDGEHVVLRVPEADAAELWRFVGTQHIAAPLDLVRTADGHDVLLPWCTSTVSAFLARRERAGAALEPGEWTTLVSSILHGLGELGAAVRDLRGQWWLTDAGRPVLVPGGPDPAVDAAERILALAVDSGAERGLVRLLAQSRALLGEDVCTPAKLGRAERDLCAFAAPKALRLDLHPPETVVGSAAQMLRRDTIAAPRHRARERVGWAQTVPSGLLKPLEAIRDRMDARRATRRGARTQRAGAEPGRATSTHRRPLLVAVAAAVLVLGAGMLWPDDRGQEAAQAIARSGADAAGAGSPSDADSAEAEAPDGADAAEGGARDPEPAQDASAGAHEQSAGDESGGERDGSPRGGADTDDETSAGASPEEAAVALLGELDACVGASSAEHCPAIAAESSLKPDEILRGSDAGAVALVDDYGDLAVVRIGADGHRQQMLVLVRLDEKWLVRDAYDVADQPGQG